ncbi:MAG: hypothetical protein CO031_01825 [Candidatus Nealsonbacteria bacterium CG_4_9_14_0_2_um_filter_37_38]|nr:MAG: hypothetical protein COZ89_02535 [Candidatus Nealsonbacteria bacterium CG_4_8_14_3_um_filter_37_23]PJC51598.1 MAG: hypothetical protein CO031_01825 [Candidatus Nealsonbacteria bacterium CG_4_9_14_0_2_um_filter_37_38]
MFKKFGLKKKIILTVPIALISLEIFFGLIIGYLAGKFFSGKRQGQTGIVKSIIFNVGNYRLHLHHWIACSGALAFLSLFNFPAVFAHFSCGILGGLIFQGIFCYQDWYKIITKCSS